MTHMKNVFGFALAAIINNHVCALNPSESAGEGSLRSKKSVGTSGGGVITVCAQGIDEDYIRNTMCPLKMDMDAYMKSFSVFAPLKDIKVVCYDEDTVSSEKMGEGVTGADGCVKVPYDGDVKWDTFWGGSGPDIFCLLTASDFSYETTVTSTKSNVSGLSHTFDTVTMQLRACGSKKWEREHFGNLLPETFQPACVLHDECYDTCGADKTKCDLAQYTRHMMFDHRWAGVAFTGVTVLGGSAFTDAQKEGVCKKDTRCGTSDNTMVFSEN